MDSWRGRRPVIVVAHRAFSIVPRQLKLRVALLLAHGALLRAAYLLAHAVFVRRPRGFVRPRLWFRSIRSFVTLSFRGLVRRSIVVADKIMNSLECSTDSMNFLSRGVRMENETIVSHGISHRVTKYITIHTSVL